VPAAVPCSTRSGVSKARSRATDSSKTKDYFKKFDHKFDNNYSSPASKNEIAKGEVFYFDPNTISAEEWKRLGVRDKTIVTIHKYISKGGKFTRPSDIAKIWGLSPADQQRLIPYVSIKNENRPDFPPKKDDVKMPSYPAKISTLVDVSCRYNGLYWPPGNRQQAVTAHHCISK